MKVLLATLLSFYPLLNEPVPTDEEMAIVYIIRPAWTGHVVRSSIDLNDKYIGSTFGFTYLRTKVKPGSHVFIGEMQNRARLELNVEKGKTYYIKQKIHPGVVTINNELELIEEGKALKLLRKCRPSTTRESY